VGTATSTQLFARRLIGCRKRLRLSQQELADALGCALRTVQGWESAKEQRIPHDPQLRNLAALLKVDVAYLTGEENEPRKFEDSDRPYRVEVSDPELQLRTVLASFTEAELIEKSMRALSDKEIPETERASRAKPFIDELARRGTSSTKPSAAGALLTRAEQQDSAHSK